MESESKTRTAVWLKPSTIRKIDTWMAPDNCETRSEFIEKALVLKAKMSKWYGYRILI